MKLTSKIAGTAVAVLALGGTGIGSAVAASAVAPAAVRAGQPEPASPDTDAIQQGDQTTRTLRQPQQPGPSRPSQARQTTPGEAAGSENSSASDRPGGHPDPAGSAQHEFDGVE